MTCRQHYLLRVYFPKIYLKSSVLEIHRSIRKIVTRLPRWLTNDLFTPTIKLNYSSCYVNLGNGAGSQVTKLLLPLSTSELLIFPNLYFFCSFLNYPFSPGFSLCNITSGQGRHYWPIYSGNSRPIILSADFSWSHERQINIQTQTSIIHVCIQLKFNFIFLPKNMPYHHRHQFPLL